MPDTMSNTRGEIIAEIVVKDRDIKKYFSRDEWKDMSDYEKDQTRNMLRNHLAMIACGINVPLPSFIAKCENTSKALSGDVSKTVVKKRAGGKPSNAESKKPFPNGAKNVVKSGNDIENQVKSDYLTRSKSKALKFKIKKRSSFASCC